MTTSSSTEQTRDQTIRSALRRARLSRVVTQAEIAAALGVIRPTIAQYEAGKHPITVSTLLRIAEYRRLGSRSRGSTWPLLDAAIAPGGVLTRPDDQPARDNAELVALARLRLDR